MNKEIKEIIEELEECKITKHLNYNLDNKDARLILDYITNLHQKIELNYQDINNLIYQLAKIKGENERLKEKYQLEKGE